MVEHVAEPGPEHVAEAGPEPNAAQAEYWSGARGTHWVTHQDRYDRMAEPLGAHLLAAAAVGRADRVLDVGCGCGAMTRDAARATTAGRALGIDLSPPMIEAARTRAAREGVDNVEFRVADAQVEPLGRAGFDVVMSRFGVMFFADPAAAFANIAAALAHGGRLCFLCWQEVVRVEWIWAPMSAALAHVPPPHPGPPDAGPGPFSLADPAHVRALLAGSGFSDVAVEGVEEELVLGSDADETTDFLLATGMGQTLLAGEDPAATAAAVAALREVVRQHASPRGVHFGSAAWLVTARR